MAGAELSKPQAYLPYVEDFDNEHRPKMARRCEAKWKIYFFTTP